MDSCSVSKTFVQTRDGPRISVPSLGVDKTSQGALSVKMGSTIYSQPYSPQPDIYYFWALFFNADDSPMLVLTSLFTKYYFLDIFGFLGISGFSIQELYKLTLCVEFPSTDPILKLKLFDMSWNSVQEIEDLNRPFFPKSPEPQTPGDFIWFLEPIFAEVKVLLRFER